MARRSDVGVLSMYATMDTKDFTRSLKETGKRTAAFSVSMKGHFNSIGSSITELSSKLGLVSQAMRTVGIAAVVAKDAFKLLSATGDEAANIFEHMDQVLRKMPFGLGEVYALASDNSPFREVTKATEEWGKAMEETRRQAEALADIKIGYIGSEEAMREELKYLRKRNRTIGTADEELYQRQFALERKLLALRRKADATIEQVGPARAAEIEASYERQKKLLKEMFRVEHINLNKKRKTDEAAKLFADDLRRAAEEQRALETDRLRKLADEKKIQEQLLSLEKQRAKQAGRVSDAQAGGFTGATTTVSTAIGAYKVADEARTLQIAKEHLKETQREVELLREIKTEIIETVGGVLS